jgi:hypothetical protein
MRTALLLLLILVALPGWCQPGAVGVEPRSTFSFEFPQPVDDLYQFGAAASAGVRLASSRRPWLGVSLDIQYAELALQTGNHFDLSILGPELGLDLRFRLISWLEASVRAAGGGSLAWTVTDVLPYSDRAAFGATARLGTGLVFRIGRFRLGAGADIHGLFGLSTSISVGLNGGWALETPAVTVQREEQVPEQPQPLGVERPAAGEGKLSIAEISIPAIFPVMRNYYSEHHIGTVVIANDSDAPVSDVVVTVDMPGFIDTPLPSARFESLPPGSREEVELLALFNKSILEITESEHAPATIAVDYVSGGSVVQEREVVPVDFHDRNTLTWDDNSKVAMFVTARDPEVKMWAGNLSAAVTNTGNTFVDPNLQHAMMMHAAIAAAGLAYAPDPTTPYATMSEDPVALDFVQFPFQTLSVRTGDCDDLSVLYASLLQAAGRDTAFVLTPGHIFVAVRLDADPRTVAEQYSAPEDLIVRDDGVWLPVEVTQVREDFVQAWAAGARQWRESSLRGDAELIPLAQAWQTYPSVAFSVGRTDFTPPDEETVTAAFTMQLRQFILREIAPRQTALERHLEDRPDDDRARNLLGVLFARFGLYADAEKAFAPAAEHGYVAATANLGNLAFLRREYEDAADYYRAALEQKPDLPAALLGLARVHYEQENYGLVRELYDQLVVAAPGLASRYTYLRPGGDATARASDEAALAATVEWEEEP